MSTYVVYILEKMTTREYVDEYGCSVHIGEDDDEGVRCRWKDSQRLLSGVGRLDVTETDEGLGHCLVIRDVQLGDAGLYVVKLTERHDESLVQSSSATLTVLPHQLTSVGLYSQFPIPVFLTYSCFCFSSRAFSLEILLFYVHYTS